MALADEKQEKGTMTFGMPDIFPLGLHKHGPTPFFINRGDPKFSFVKKSFGTPKEIEMNKIGKPYFI